MACSRLASRDVSASPRSKAKSFADIMRQPVGQTTKLPKLLLQELDVDTHIGASRMSHSSANRKEQRKVARVQKRRGRVPISKGDRLEDMTIKDHTNALPKSSGFHQLSESKASSIKARSSQSDKKSQGLKKQDPDSLPASSVPDKVSRAMRDRLAADDAEIAALERVLGMKGKNKIPKSFKDDGLDSLLVEEDESVDSGDDRPGKRKRGEEQDWLEKKRQKLRAGKTATDSIEKNDESEETVPDSELDSNSDSENQFDRGLHEEALNASDFSDEMVENPFPRELSKPQRENPYVAPVTPSNLEQQARFVPPPLRDNAVRSEDLSRLSRQIQGLLNRLSEANLVSILGDVEKVYRVHPRQHVTTTLLDSLTKLISDPATLQDTFIILHAGFIAAVYRVVGNDFGAQAIQRIHDVFHENYEGDRGEEGTGKRLNNLMSALAVLYNFHVVGSGLVYDFVRLFLQRLDELSTELLLKVVRLAGPQLRQDDPSSLKDIVLQLQGLVGKYGDEHFSVRTRFMIETINNLKNNRMKTGIAAATITSEHMLLMKKKLGNLNTQNPRASEPLRVSLKDLRDRDKKGTWWLVGASYKGNAIDTDVQERFLKVDNDQNQNSDRDEFATDLLHLAKEQHMNTDVRRSIFIAIMSSSDFNDAFLRLMKLRLKKTQELEIPKVIVHCAGAEEVYNPFYTHLSRRVCSARKLKMSFKFSLWDLFKRMGEGDEDFDERRVDPDEEEIDLRCLVNVARMYGTLIAEESLDLGVLKKLDLAILEPKISTFVELLLVTSILHSQQNSDGRRNQKALLDVFMKTKEISEMSSGLRYFLKTIVRKTDIAESKSDKDVIRWACKVICDALKVVAMQIIADE